MKHLNFQLTTTWSSAIWLIFYAIRFHHQVEINLFSFHIKSCKCAIGWYENKKKTKIYKYLCRIKGIRLHHVTYIRILTRKYPQGKIVNMSEMFRMPELNLVPRIFGLNILGFWTFFSSIMLTRWLVGLFFLNCK